MMRYDFKVIGIKVVAFGVILIIEPKNFVPTCLLPNSFLQSFCVASGILLIKNVLHAKLEDTQNTMPRLSALVTPNMQALVCYT